jgi:hypothetical protein
VRRIAKLRRSIRVDPRPFTPIPRNPHARHRQHQIMRRIYTLEAELLEQLAGINRDLDRRLRR